MNTLLTILYITSLYFVYSVLGVVFIVGYSTFIPNKSERGNEALDRFVEFVEKDDDSTDGAGFMMSMFRLFFLAVPFFVYTIISLHIKEDNDERE